MRSTTKISQKQILSQVQVQQSVMIHLLLLFFINFLIRLFAGLMEAGLLIADLFWGVWF